MLSSEFDETTGDTIIKHLAQCSLNAHLKSVAEKSNLIMATGLSHVFKFYLQHLEILEPVQSGTNSILHWLAEDSYHISLHSIEA